MSCCHLNFLDHQNSSSRNDLFLLRSEESSVLAASSRLRKNPLIKEENVNLTNIEKDKLKKIIDRELKE